MNLQSSVQLSSTDDGAAELNQTTNCINCIQILDIGTEYMRLRLQSSQVTELVAIKAPTYTPETEKEVSVQLEGVQLERWLHGLEGVQSTEVRAAAGPTEEMPSSTNYVVPQCTFVYINTRSQCTGYFRVHGMLYSTMFTDQQQMNKQGFIH